MEKSILIHNFHQAGTQALVRDFNRLGYTVYSPIDNWSDRIKYYRKDAHSLDSNFLTNTTLITHDQFLDIRPSHVVAGCFEQYDDFTKLANEVGAKIVIGVAGNDQPVIDGDYLLSPDIMTYAKYNIPKVLWLHEPVIPLVEKDIEGSFNTKQANSYISNYAEFFPDGWRCAKDFQSKWEKTSFYGSEFLYVEDRNHLSRLYSESFVTMYFKDRDCYGQVVLESMVLGTPVVAIRRLIAGKTLGELFLNDSNAILGDNIDEIINRMSNMTYSEYEQLSVNARNTIIEKTDIESRLNLMRSIGL